jgi:hypothetical protein
MFAEIAEKKKYYKLEDSPARKHSQKYLEMFAEIAEKKKDYRNNASW